LIELYIHATSVSSLMYFGLTIHIDFELSLRSLVSRWLCILSLNLVVILLTVTIYIIVRVFSQYSFH